MALSPTSSRSSSGGSSVVVVATLALSSAQILALDGNTPIIAVAAPGANKMILPLSYLVHYHSGGIAYTSPGTMHMFIGSDYNAANIFGSINQPAINGTADSIGFGSPVADFGEAANAVDGLNQPFGFQFSQAVTTGNGTLKFVVAYTVADVS